MRVIHTAMTETRGGRKHGVGRSFDGSIDIRLVAPGSGQIGCNPEQLLAIACSSSLASALSQCARRSAVDLPGDVRIQAEVDLGIEGDTQLLAIRLHVDLETLTTETAVGMVVDALKLCAYSNALCRNVTFNVDVTNEDGMTVVR